MSRARLAAAVPAGGGPTRARYHSHVSPGAGRWTANPVAAVHAPHAAVCPMPAGWDGGAGRRPSRRLQGHFLSAARDGCSPA
jgi:hypothetical protein